MIEVVAVLGLLAGAQLVASWLTAARRGFAAAHRPLAASSGPDRPPETWPSVSVVVPAWRERGTIERCLISLREVDYPTWETVVVAGGPDGTYEAAELEGRQLPGCRVIRQEALGKPAALNAGLRFSTGEVIVVLDADSHVSRNWLRALVAPIGDAVQATTGNARPARSTAISRSELMERIELYEVRRETILQGAASIAVTRALLDELGGFAVDAYADDWELDARLAIKGIGRAYAPDALVTTERPSTFGEFWHNDIRWRRAHLVSLIRFRNYFLGDPASAARSLFPYLAAWLVASLAIALAATALAGYATLAGSIGALLVIVVAWLLLRRLALVLEVAAFTGEKRWLRDLWAPPALFAISLVAAWLASLTVRRATLSFKGPRPGAETDRPGIAASPRDR